MLVYDGENLKDTDPRAKSYQEYRDYAGVDEGMSGVSTRFAFKILSKVFNFDPAEVAANPVHLMYVLEQQIEREQFPAETEQKYLGFIKEHLAARYAEFIGKEIQTAYLESYSEYGQNIFDRYVTYADYWIQDQEYRDTDTGEVFDRALAERRAREDREARGHLATRRTSATRSSTSCCARAPTTPARTRLWTSYEKLRTVIEKKMFSNTEELLPVISFNAKASADEAKKHENFVNRMVAEGLHAQAGAPALRVVSAGAQEQLITRTSGTRHAAADHRPPARRQEQVDRQPRAVPAPLPGADRATRCGRRSTSAASATSSRAKTSTCPSATSASRCSATARAARARSCTRATRSTCAATASSGRRAAAAAAAAAARPATPARARTTSSSTSPRKSSCRSSSTTWRCRA